MLDAVAVSFVVYTLAIVGLGIYSARFAKRTEADFFLADRGLGAWVAALLSSAFSFLDSAVVTYMTVHDSGTRDLLSSRMT